MRTKAGNIFTTIRTEGAILPADLLQRISARKNELQGIDPETYHLLKGERINEIINRSWNRLLGAWASFKSATEKLPEGERGTRQTREKWLLPLFQELSYGRLQPSKSFEIDGKTYPISHFWNHSPIHLVGFRIDMDKRTTGVAGAARTSPHSLVQELLNQSEDYLWGFVSNGLRLRILRDNVSLTRQAYVEFDLEGMMDSEVYSDFSLLWLLCHQSRVESERPETCWLEKWSKAAKDQGIRALDKLRDGVESAIKNLGVGFLAHQGNLSLKDKLKSGELSKQEFYRQILRVVYRILFLFVAEDRYLLNDPKADKKAKETYLKYYSVSRIRSLAEKRRGTQHVDSWRGLKLVFDKLGSKKGCPELALPALGSFLWSNQAISGLDDCDIANYDLLEAVRSLAFTIDRNVRRAVDYMNMGSEELGSVYESLLEMHPDINVDSGTFELRTAGGHERKTTGAYYTPDSLVQCLLDSALEPVLDEAVKKDDPEKAILNLKVCDPACGSGHFLIAASHRMAKRLAAIRTGDDEPAPEATRQALRDIVGRCLYGVDINPMAVELCKVNLWMEALEPGKPLSFLEHHIQCGNSLLGTTPALMKKGIPDDALKPIEGDDKEYCRKWKKANKEDKKSISLLKRGQMPWDRLGDLPASMAGIDAISDEDVDGIEQKHKRYQEHVQSVGYMNQTFLADAWCAAFVWKKKSEKDGGFPYPITEEVFRNIENNPHSVPKWLQEEIQRLGKQYQFFHWHIAFPDIFRLPSKDEKPESKIGGWIGGFDCVLGNPPWEKIKMQEKEWFSERNPEIANAPSKAARQKMIRNLSTEDPALEGAYLEDKRKAEGESHFIRNSNRYPLCGRGDINTYAIFAETNMIIISALGKVGCIVPTGVATDDTTKFFFQDLMKYKSLVSLFDFENKEAIFQGVHRSYKFCLLTLTGYKRPAVKGADFLFYALDPLSIKEEDRCFTLSVDDIELLNPNTKTCPIFKASRDAEITKFVYNNVPIILKEGTSGHNYWGITYLRMIDMTNDSKFFKTKEELENRGWVLKGNIFEKNQKKYLPLYEGKMIWQYNHRAASVEYYGGIVQGRHDVRETNFRELSNDKYSPQPRFWIEAKEVNKRLPQNYNYMLSFRDITNSSSERTNIVSIIPRSATGNNIPLLLFGDKSARKMVCFLGEITSFILDYVSRQKLGGNHLNYFLLKQLPIHKPQFYNEVSMLLGQKVEDWIVCRGLELSYSSWDLEQFVIDSGYNGPPFIWDEERRLLIRCELDAAYFHLYEIDRDEVNYIMETFPIVKRKDEQAYGHYRTKETILEIYDEMEKAIRTGKPYQTRLDPSPGPPMNPDGTFAKLPNWPAGAPKPPNWPPHIHEPRRDK